MLLGEAKVWCVGEGFVSQLGWPQVHGIWGLQQFGVG